MVEIIVAVLPFNNLSHTGIIPKRGLWYLKAKPEIIITSKNNFNRAGSPAQYVGYANTMCSLQVISYLEFFKSSDRGMEL